MSRITKYVCDFCQKEVADTYLHNGWIEIHGHITRSWGIREPNGTGTKDYISRDPEFCSIQCLIKALDDQRAKKGGPMDLTEEPKPEPKPEVKKSWEDMLPDDEPPSTTGHWRAP